MRRIILSLVVVSAVLSFVSCARGITVEQAANGKAKCGRNYLK